MVNNSDVRRIGRFIALGIVTVSVKFILTSHPIPQRKTPRGEWCSLIYLDAYPVERSGSAEDKDQEVDLSVVRNLWAFLTEEREDRGAISLRRYDHSEGIFVELYSLDAKYRESEPADVVLRVKHSLKHRSTFLSLGKIFGENLADRNRDSESRPFEFTKLSIENAARLLNRYKDKETTCGKWEIFILSPGIGKSWQLDDTHALQSRSYRLCPTKSRVVFVSDPPFADVLEDQPTYVQDFVDSTGHVFWSKLTEYRAWEESREHLILLDVSGSLTKEAENTIISEPEEWSTHALAERVLPSFRSMVPYFPGHGFSIHIFADEIEPVTMGSLDDLIVTPRITRDKIEKIGVRNTSLSKVMEFLRSGNGKQYRSVWIYTDADDDPGGDLNQRVFLEEWMKAEPRCWGQPPEPRGKLYLQLPTRVPIGSDKNVELFVKAAERCLGFDVEVMSAPPPPEALQLCRS